MNRLISKQCLLYIAFSLLSLGHLIAQAPVAPSLSELNQPFDEGDKKTFSHPPKVFYPETWFHYIGGNVSIKGITADLEAIADAGFSGIHLFHGQFGGPWPGVDPQIACLSPLWDGMVKHTAEECRRLGLRFTMQNCPGWAMAGGPWIKPSNAMRHLAWSRTDIEGNSDEIMQKLPLPQPSEEDWRDYEDLMVIAFPTPVDDDGKPLIPASFKSNKEAAWEHLWQGKSENPIQLTATTAENPYWIEVEFPENEIIRTLELPSSNEMNHPWCFEPDMRVKLEAYLPDGTTRGSSEHRPSPEQYTR